MLNEAISYLFSPFHYYIPDGTFRHFRAKIWQFFSYIKFAILRISRLLSCEMFGWVSRRNKSRHFSFLMYWKNNKINWCHQQKKTSSSSCLVEFLLESRTTFKYGKNEGGIFRLPFFLHTPLDLSASWSECAKMSTICGPEPPDKLVNCTLTKKRPTNYHCLELLVTERGKTKERGELIPPSLTQPNTLWIEKILMKECSIQLKQMMFLSRLAICFFLCFFLGGSTLSDRRN